MARKSTIIGRGMGKGRFMSFEKIIVIDFETTGISGDKRAVEIAWFELNRNLEIVDERSSLINPQIPIPKRASDVHGITDRDVRDQPTLDEFMIQMNRNPFIDEKVCVVAHNISFDLPLFRKYCGGIIELCTLKLARAVFPDLPNHQLGTISKTFGFMHESAHRARSDAMQVVHFLTLVQSAHGMDIDRMVMLASKGQQRQFQNGSRVTHSKTQPSVQSVQCTECFLLVNRGLKSCPLDDTSCPLFE
jgi:DNA polymerase III alpha subunit (gram-positive type)